MKCKKLLSLALAVCMTFGSAAVLPQNSFIGQTDITASAVSTATSGKCGENVSWSLKDGVLTISGTGSMMDYDSAYESRKSPFCKRTDIKSIIIKPGVTSIGKLAFEECSELKSSTIPSGVKSIGYGAFSSCYKLTSITIPNSVTSIGDYAFSVSGLKSITIPNSVTNIGIGAFSGSGLTSITIPNSVKSIGDSAFEGCEKLKSITIPNSVTSIGGYAFRGCKNLTSITIPNSVTSIGREAFYSCKSLKSIKLPKNITSIEEYLFENCTNLTGITIPDKVKRIDSNAFQNCLSLTAITIPGSVKIIENDSFINCKGLKTVTIQNGLREIGKNAFTDCTNLTSITLPKSLVSIGEKAFWSCSALKSVTMQNGLKSIGESAFESCNNLTSINIPESVESVGVSAFDYTKWLDELKKRSSVVIVSGILLDAKSYSGKTLKVPGSVRLIADSAFGDHYNQSDNLETVTIPGSVKKIGNEAFRFCDNLKRVNLSEGLTEIGYEAFMGCEQLESMTIPNTVEQIGIDAFCWTKWIDDQRKKSPMVIGGHVLIDARQCTGKVTVPAKITSVSRAFRGSKITSVVFLGKIKRIDDGAFENSNIESITIPGTVESIGNDAFRRCTKLKKVIIENGVKTIGYNAFFNCISLGSVTIPKSVTSIGSNAFGTYAYEGFMMSVGGFTLKCYKNTAGEEYAKENNLKYKVLDAVEPKKDDGCVDISFNTVYQQTDARKMFDMVNKFRQSNEAWYWNEDNTKKEYQKDLKKLKYDYELEKCAMQRAAELIVKWENGHIRPNGENCITILPDEFGKICGECIAIGDFSFNDPESVFYGWQENDKDYSNQGHRRIMLRPYYNSIGIAHAKYKETNFWVLVTSSEIADTEYKAPNNKSTKVTVRTKKELIIKDKLTAGKTSVNICDGKKTALPKVTRTMRFGSQWYLTPDIVTNVSAKWGVKSGKDVVKLSGGSIVPLKSGSAVLTAAANGKTIEVNVTVGHKFSAWKTTSFNVDNGTSTQKRTCSVCKKTETRPVKNAVVRYAGANRYDTAAMLSKASHKTTSDTVIIADAMTFQDALIAVPLAKAYNAPLLLANPNIVTKQTEAELARLKAKKVIIVNTNKALKKGTLDALKKKYTTQIIRGNNCFETSKRVAEELQKKTKKAPTDVFFTTNKAFADALSISPVAALKGAPILYVDPSKKTLDSNILAYLNKVKGSIKNVYIVGGTVAVPKAIENSIKKALPKKNVKRFDGAQRYETCVMINKYFAKDLSSKTVCIAKGLDFPDALAGGVFAANQKAPLLLADSALRDTHKSFLKDKKPNKLYIFGGKVAVPDKLAKEVAKMSV